MFVKRNTNKLYSTDWMEQFQSWDLPINSFWQKIQNLTTEADKLKEELKAMFPVDLTDIRRYPPSLSWNQISNQFFKKKRKVPFASLNPINEELNRLKQIGVHSKVEHSEWASPTVYVQKKSKEIRVCADFLPRIEQSFKRLPLPSPESRRDLFKTQRRNIFFQKSIWVIHISRYPWTRSARSCYV